MGKWQILIILVYNNNTGMKMTKINSSGDYKRWSYKIMKYENDKI